MKGKKITIIGFVTILAVGMIATCLTGYRTIGKSLYTALKTDTNVVEKMDSVFDSAEESVSDAFVLHDVWIDLYGGVQKCLGKTIVPDANDSHTVLKGSDGKLYFQNSVFENSEQDREDMLASLKAFYQYCGKNDVDFLYVTAPHKYYSAEIALPVNTVHDYYDDAAWLSASLQSEGIPEMNLMKKWADESETYADGFFATDHHWNIQTAFWGFQKIADRIATSSERGCASEQNFKEVVDKNSFLGSMGTRVGSIYGGKDDISIISPVYDTDFEVTYHSKTLGKQIVRSGSWEEAILTSPASYSMYLTSDNALVHVENRKINDGRNVLLIKDSFGIPVAAWLSCMFENMWEMDLRYEQDESVTDFIKTHDIDVVVVLYNPEAIGNGVFYNFTEVSSGK